MIANSNSMTNSKDSLTANARMALVDRCSVMGIRRQKMISANRGRHDVPLTDESETTETKGRSTAVSALTTSDTVPSNGKGSRRCRAADMFCEAGDLTYVYRPSSF